ncbi:Serine-type D-Ala-D-Ala carboxypeptidase [Candidatus Desulforudis audaxviator MP104C]|uniref:serine-type D-Ala-D-Ala carboxypeptidase n=2 Tax=Candidatus Desulforudis TaxID=471826 RepID=B1I3X1_DESAP|nr:Serine-type D-Ala-D-Ala carboxypeptidase [Candidatus Desulforudis audaxviator MP104C]
MFAGPAAAAGTAEKGPETEAESAVLLEPVSGQILYEKEPYKEQPIASVTKIMTMLLAVEALDSGKAKLDDIIVTSEHAAGMGGSQIYLAPQEKMSFREMLISVATGSANDASVAIAEHVAGSEEAFVQMMNDRAAELGAKHTHYVNPTGLPAEGHYSCAYDQAVILREALKYPLFREVSAIKEYDLRGGEFKLWNTNKLLWWYPGADAGKTGWTNEAKYCLASSVKKDNLRLIAVVLGVPETKGHFRESIKLYNWGFARFEAVVLAGEGELIKTLPVDKGVDTTVDLIVPHEVCVVVPRGEKEGVDFRVELPSWPAAPLKQDEALGSYVVLHNGKEVLRVDIVPAKDVPEASFVQQFTRMAERICG